MPTARSFTASFPGVRILMATVLLASFVAQLKGTKFYDLRVSGACQGDRVFLVRRPENPFDVNCLDVRLVRCPRYLLGHLEAPIATLLSPLMHGLFLEVSG